jgi:ABC-type thiamin/hydroxymethylpyrimidine transport system permease subunit
METNPQQEAAEAAKLLVDKIDTIIIFPVITLLTAVAFLIFIYGAAIYIVNANNDSARAEGKKSITYGLIGMTIMISAYAIFRIGVGTFGLNEQLDCATNPTEGCFQFEETTIP